MRCDDEREMRAMPLPSAPCQNVSARALLCTSRQLSASARAAAADADAARLLCTRRRGECTWRRRCARRAGHRPAARCARRFGGGGSSAARCAWWRCAGSACCAHSRHCPARATTRSKCHGLARTWLRCRLRGPLPPLGRSARRRVRALAHASKPWSRLHAACVAETTRRLLQAGRRACFMATLRG
jgi:hypothetical protein